MMSNGTLASITIGDVNGIIDIHTAVAELGSLPTLIENMRATIMGMIANDCSCEASWMLSTAEPIAAKIEAKKRNPPMRNRVIMPNSFAI